MYASKKYYQGWTTPASNQATPNLGRSWCTLILCVSWVFIKFTMMKIDLQKSPSNKFPRPKRIGKQENTSTSETLVLADYLAQPALTTRMNLPRLRLVIKIISSLLHVVSTTKSRYLECVLFVIRLGALTTNNTKCYLGTGTFLRKTKYCSPPLPLWMEWQPRKIKQLKGLRKGQQPHIHILALTRSASHTFSTSFKKDTRVEGSESLFSPSTWTLNLSEATQAELAPTPWLASRVSLLPLRVVSARELLALRTEARW